MEEVLWHSATWRFSKSILVKIPRLPTMRVIGSQFISTSFLVSPGAWVVGAVVVLIRCRSFLLVALRVIAGGKFGFRMAPLRLRIESLIGERAQSADSPPVDPHDTCRK